MKFLLNTALSLTCALGATSAFAACDTGETVIKFSHVTNTDKHPKGIAATLLEQRVNDEMNGKACMEVFPNSTLYDDNKVLEALLDSMQKRGLQGLTFWHNGMKQMSANVPLMSPADANGLKFRVMSSDVLVAQMEALGGAPQKMAFSEVYGGLQQGVVDGQENTWSNIYGKKFFEVQDGITETNHGIIDYLVVTSVDWLDSLEADVRDQFLTILNEVTELRNAQSFAVNQANRQAIIEAGSTVRTLTPEERQAWVDVMKPVWDQFADDVGQDMINAAQSLN